MAEIELFKDDNGYEYEKPPVETSLKWKEEFNDFLGEEIKKLEEEFKDGKESKQQIFGNQQM